MISISIGCNHVLFLIDEKVYACGKNTHGELGLGHKRECKIPQKITFFAQHHVVSVATGRHVSYFVTKDKEVFACGKGQFITDIHGLCHP